MINKFFLAIKESLEEHSLDLKQGKLFLPLGLKGKRLTNNVLPSVIRTLSSELNMDFEAEVQNIMPDNYNLNPQRLDFVFKKHGKELIFFEFESLDRSQVYLFKDYSTMDENWNDNKLRYYMGTLEEKIRKNLPLPKYYVSFLVLPDCAVNPYTIWDCNKHYNFFHGSLRKVIYRNPYRFYDGIIKSCARLFLETKISRFGKKIKDFQDRCELIIITCTIKELILSRGRDGFCRQQETRRVINWKI